MSVQLIAMFRAMLVFTSSGRLICKLVFILYYRNSARFMWKRIPEPVKEGNLELAAAWKIVQVMWTHDHAAVYGALKGYNWTSQVLPVARALGGEIVGCILPMLLSAKFTCLLWDACFYCHLGDTVCT